MALPNARPGNRNQTSGCVARFATMTTAIRRAIRASTRASSGIALTVRRFGVTYPSFWSPDGEALLAFPGVLGLRTIPAFAILDAQGRVAGSIIGRLPSQQTLVDLTEGVDQKATGQSRNG